MRTWNGIQSKCNIQKELKLVYGNKNVKLNQDSICIDKTDLPIPTGKTFHELPVSLLNEIEKKKIQGIEVYRQFKFSDISLWWFIYPTIFTTFARTVFYIIKFEEMIDSKKPSIIEIVGEFDNLQLIKQICDKRKIVVSYSRLSYFKHLLKKKIKSVIQPFRYKTITKRKIKKRLNLFESLRKEIPSVDDKIIFFLATAYRRDVYDVATKGTLRGEYLIEPVINLIKKMNLDTVGIDVDYTFKGESEVLAERLGTSIPWFPLEAILKRFSPRTSTDDFLNHYSKIIENHEFRSLFTYDGIMFWDQIEYDFKMLRYLPYLPSYLFMIDSFKQFFNKHKPRAVFIPYETGPYALAIIIACQKNGVKTIGMQHGGLIVKHPDYTHTIFQTDDNSLGMPLPDYFMLFGNYFKKELIHQSDYPNNKLIIFGNPIYFEIDEILKNLECENLRRKYNLPENKKIILFTSAQFQKYYSVGGQRDYDEQILKSLLNGFANNEDYHIVLKPHPVEKYLESYEKMIKEFNCTNFEIKQGNLFELLHVADTVVSFFSTSLIDSVLLQKPTIRVIFQGTEVTSLFTEYGIFLESSLESLPNNITRLLNDKSLQENLMKNRTKFIHDQYNIPNPNAFEQLKSLIQIK